MLRDTPFTCHLAQVPESLWEVPGGGIAGSDSSALVISINFWMSTPSRQVRGGKRGPQNSEDEGELRCDALTLRSKEGHVCPSSLEEVAAPQARGQADGGFNFIQIVPIKALQGIG